MGNSYSRVEPPAEQGPIEVPANNYSRRLDVTPTHDETTLTESVFHSMFTLERQRAERSRKPFVLMLLDANRENGAAARILRQAVNVTLASNRETDLVGWYKESAILGVLFTEVNMDGKRPITEILRTKIEMALIKHMGRERAAKIAISMHVFPETLDKNQSGWVADTKLYPDLKRKDSRKRVPLSIKRAIGIVGSGALGLIMLPMRAAIAAVIKPAYRILERPARQDVDAGPESSRSVEA